MRKKKKDHTNLAKALEEEGIRKKLLERGAFSLSNTELLSLLLSGMCPDATLATAHELLAQAGNSLSQLNKVPVAKLSAQLPPSAQSGAYAVVSALEIGRRLQVETQSAPLSLSGPHDVKLLMKAYLSGLPHEEFWILLLNQNKSLLSRKQISMGGTTSSSIDIKIILRYALEEPTCTAIVLVHNHPSGQVRHSESDIALTKHIISAAEIIGIQVLDHIIYTDDSCISMHQLALLNLAGIARVAHSPLHLPAQQPKQIPSITINKDS